MANGTPEPEKKMATPWQKAKMREHDIECPDWFTYDDAYEIVGKIFEDEIAEAKELVEQKKKDHEYLGLELDEEQKEAAKYPYDKPLLVSAGPGAGKTRVVVERVKDLILNQGLKDDQILCMTFSRAAAETMTRRLEKELKGHDLRNQIKTFHALCYSLMGPFDVFEVKEQDNDNENVKTLSEDGEEWKKKFLDMFEYHSDEEWKNDKQKWEEEFQKQCNEVVDENVQRKEELETVKTRLKEIDLEEEGEEQFQLEDKKKKLEQKIQELERKINDPGHFLDYKFKQMEINEKSFLELAEAVSAFKTEDKDLEDLEKYLGDKKIDGDPYLQRLEDLKKYFNAYNKYMKNLKKIWNNKTKNWKEIAKPSWEKKVIHNVKDYDDFLLDTIHETDSSFRLKLYGDKKYKSKLKHIIIDEFQDNNYLQFELAKLLATGKAENHITVVGDINQTIYTFQGANPEIFNNFKDYYKPKEIHLKYNYRSTPQIVELANKLLKKDSYLDETHYESITKNDSGKKIQINEFCNTEDEYDFFQEVIFDKIGKEFQRRGKKEEITFGNFVILARTNAIRLQIRKALINRGIPVRSKKYHKLEYAKPGLLYTKMLSSLLTQYESSLSENPYLSKLQEKLGERFDHEVKLSELLEHDETIPGLMNRQTKETMIKVLYYLARCYMKEHGKDVTIKRFYDYITNFAPKFGENPRMNIGDGVEVRTVHSVKGGEFPFVIISSSYQKHFPLDYRARELKVPPEYLQYKRKNCMGCNTELDENREEIFCPNPNCDVDIEKELHGMEERRLYYVAITRAMNELFITVPKKIENPNTDEWDEPRVSKFLVDLDYNTDPENIDWEDRCESVKMSAEEIDKMDTQHKQRWKDEKQQWKDEFDKRYDQVVNENRRLRERLEKILAGGGSDSEKEKLEQRIQELERELRDSKFEKGKHSTFDESETSWEILELQPGSSVEQIKKAFQKFSLFWHPDKHHFATPARKEHAQMQFKRIKNAYDDLMSKN